MSFQLNAMTERLNAAQSMEKRLTEKWQTERRERDQAMKTINALHEQISAKNEDLAMWEEKAKRFESEVKKERLGRESLVYQLQSGASHQDTLAGTVQQLSRDLGLAQETIAKAQLERQSTQFQCDQLRSSLDQRESRVRELEERLNVLTKSTKTDADLVLKLKSSEDEMERERQRIRGIDTQAAALEARNAALQEVLSQKEKRLREYELTEKTIKHQNQTLESENDKLAADAASLNKALNTAQSELKTATTRAELAETQLKVTTQQV